MLAASSRAGTQTPIRWIGKPITARSRSRCATDRPLGMSTCSRKSASGWSTTGCRPQRCRMVACTVSAVSGWSAAGQRQCTSTSVPSSARLVEIRSANAGQILAVVAHLAEHDQVEQPVRPVGRDPARRRSGRAAARATGPPPARPPPARCRCRPVRRTGRPAGSRARRWRSRARTPAREPGLRQAGEHDVPLAPLVVLLGQPPRVGLGRVERVEVTGPAGRTLDRDRRTPRKSRSKWLEESAPVSTGWSPAAGPSAGSASGSRSSAARLASRTGSTSGNQRPRRRCSIADVPRRRPVPPPDRVG